MREPAGDQAMGGPTGRAVDWPVFRGPFLAATAFFTLYPLVALLAHPPRPEALVLLLAGWAIFVVVLASLFSRGRFVRPLDGPWPAVAAAAMTAIAVAAQGVYGVVDAGALYFYAGVTMARLVPERLALMGIALVALTAGLSTGHAAGSWGSGASTGVTVGTISLTLFALAALGRANLDLRAARVELAHLAVAEERSRIARDLHDTLGHSLSVIALKSELARRILADDPGRADVELADIEHVAREALASVRETVSGYRQASLAVELAGARAALAAAGIEGEVEPAPEGLPRDVDAVLGWAVREGVTNVLRHSDATTTRIRVIVTGRSHAVEVVDDGRGGPDGGDPGSSRPGVGLAGLRERAGRIGGSVEAGPLPDRGFRLRVSVPTEAAG